MTRKTTSKGNGKTAPSADLGTRGYAAGEQLGAELRSDRSPEMQRRRWIVGVSLIGVTLAQLMTLKQVGLVGRLPDLPAKETDDRVVDDAHAYTRLDTPNAVLQIVSYGATAALAAMGGTQRSTRAPWLPLALLAKTAYDSFISVQQAREAVGRQQRVSVYPALSLLGAFACLGLAAVDARGAGRSVSERSVQRWPQVRDGVRERGSAAIARGRDLGARGAGLFNRVPFVGAEARH